MGSGLGSFLKVILIAALLLAASSGCGKRRVNGGGATFVDPIMQEWAAIYKQQKGIEIDYKKSGSGDGITQMTVGTLDFGCTDAPMNKERIQAAREERGEVVHIPITIGAVVIIYNVPGIDRQLILDGRTIAEIYLGHIKSWDDAAIAALNPDLKAQLPTLPIVPVYRAEASGTTSIFTEYLSKSSSTFAEKIGTSTSPKWPKIGTGQQGNDGVAGFVSKRDNVGAIGYTEIYYAQKFNIPFARLLNKRGKAISPDQDGVVTAAADAALKITPAQEPYTLHELTYSLTDVDDDKAYPICGMSYAVLYKKQLAGKGQVIVDFLRWATTEGQQYGGDLGYAPLPEGLRDRIQKRLDQVEYE